jgi:hypothetical protein
MGSDLVMAAPTARAHKADEVYRHLREALKLKAKVESLCYESLDSAEIGEVEAFFSALEEAEAAMTRPLF